MAENAMVKEQLTDAMVEAGAELTAKLDEMGVPVTAAFWLFDAEVNEWRLYFASTDVSTKGPRSVYDTIWQAMDELGAKAALPYSMIGVKRADADLVRRLKVGAPTGPGIGRRRFSRQVADGRFIEDALIYRAA